MGLSKPIGKIRIDQIKAGFRLEELPRITAQVARAALADVLAAAPAPYSTLVDGRDTSDLDSVKPGGQIRFRFDRVSKVLAWIYHELVTRSPVGPGQNGHYQDAHRIFVNGDQVDPDQEYEVPQGAEIIFVNYQLYARKIEAGESLQAPSGVYELVERDARAAFPSTAIDFNYTAVQGGQLVAKHLNVNNSRRGAKLHNRASLRFPSITVRAP